MTWSYVRIAQIIYNDIVICKDSTDYLHENHLFYSRKVSDHKKNGQMQNNQRSLVDIRSLNGLYSI